MSEAAEVITGLQDVCELRRKGGAPQGQPKQEHRPLKHTRELFWQYWFPVLAMLTIIAVESTDMMSGAHTGRMLWRLMRWLGHPLTLEQLSTLNLVIRKCGHVVGYGLLCASWLLLLRGSYWLRHEYQLLIRGGVQIRRIWWRPVWGLLAVLATWLVASMDEFHQMGMPSRTGRWHDIGLDTASALIVMLLFRARALRHCR